MVRMRSATDRPWLTLLCRALGWPAVFSAGARRFDLSIMTSNMTVKLQLVEPLLTVFAFNAQIAAGLWRRNGFVMRNQHSFYAGVSLRDRTYAFDLFVLQAVACTLQPDHILRLIVDQFAVENWFTARPWSTFEHQQALFMAEECLQLVIGMACATFSPASPPPHTPDFLLGPPVPQSVDHGSSHWRTPRLRRPKPDGVGGRTSGCLGTLAAWPG